jgi:SAM-dependent methyltransferase
MNDARLDVNSRPTEAFSVEEARIRAAYARRQDRGAYSWFDAAYLLLAQERERHALALLAEYGCAPLSSIKILEVGCGSGHWLREFIKWGARPTYLTGVDLLPDRVFEARELCPEGVNILCGSAGNLEFPDATFDLVVQSLVFTSILDPALK